MKGKLGTACIVLGAAMLLAALGLFAMNERENVSAGAAASNALEQVFEIIENAGRAGAAATASASGSQNADRADTRGDDPATAGETATRTQETGGDPQNAGEAADPADPTSDPAESQAPALDSEANAADPNDSSQASDPALPDPYASEMTVVEIDGYGYIGCLYIPALGLELPVMSELDEWRLYVAPCRFTGSTKTDDLVIGAHNYTRHFGKLGRMNLGDEVVFVDMDGAVIRYEVVDLQVLGPYDVEELIDGTYDLSLFTCTYGGATRVVVRCDRAE